MDREDEMDGSLFATIAGSRLSFLVVLLVGMALCAGGIGKAARLGLWLHPVTLAGYLLGACALALGMQGLFHLRLLPIGDGLALVLMLGIIVVKFGLAALYSA
jgi:hypothetical protein